MTTVGPRARRLAAGKVRPTEAELTDPHRSAVHATTPLQRPRTNAEDDAARNRQSVAQRNRARIAERPNLP